MSNSNAHDHFPLPNLVVGGGAGALKGGRHLRYPGSHADDEPAGVDARQGRRAPGDARRQHRAAGEPLMGLAFGLGRLRALVADWIRRARARSSLRLCLRRHRRCSRRPRRPAAAPSARHATRRRRSRPATRPRRCRCCRRRRPNAAEADGTTALHWAVRNDDLDAGRSAAARRRQRQGRQPLRRHADPARLRQRQRRRSSSACSRPASAPTPRGRTAKRRCMTCARTGNVAAAKVLVDARGVASTRSRAGAARPR